VYNILQLLFAQLCISDSERPAHHGEHLTT